jgi:hypothetical protein
MIANDEGTSHAPEVAHAGDAWLRHQQALAQDAAPEGAGSEPVLHRCAWCPAFYTDDAATAAQHRRTHQERIGAAQRATQAADAARRADLLEIKEQGRAEVAEHRRERQRAADERQRVLRAAREAREARRLERAEAAEARRIAKVTITPRTPRHGPTARHGSHNLAITQKCGCLVCTEAAPRWRAKYAERALAKYAATRAWPRVLVEHPHGDYRRYRGGGAQGQGCRCDECRTAWATHHRERKQARRAAAAAVA